MKNLKKKKCLVLIQNPRRKNVNTKGKKINEFYNFYPIQYDSYMEDFRILQGWKII